MTEEVNIVEAIRDTLEMKMEEDERVVVLGEDVGVDGGVFRATQGLIEKFGEERVMDSPLDEAGIIGTSVGMAAYGLKPVPEIQFSGFVPQAFHQVKQHVSRMRMRTQGDINLPIVIRTPYGGGIRALEHHSESQEAIYARMGGLKVVIPSTPNDANGLLSAAIDDPDPVLYLEPKKIYRAFREEVDESHVAEIGKAAVRQEGSDITIVSWGAMAQLTREVLDDIDASVEFIDLRSINPLDEETVIQSVKKTGRLAIVAEEPKMMGVSAELSALVCEEALLHLEAPVKRITGFDVPFPLYQLEDLYMPTKKRVTKGIQETLQF